MVSTPIGPRHTPAHPAILKLNPVTGYPRLVENEDFFLGMAAGAAFRSRTTGCSTTARGSRGSSWRASTGPGITEMPFGAWPRRTPASCWGPIPRPSTA